MMRIPRLLLVLTIFAATGSVTAQKRAESSSSQSSTHRVVVVNGKKIVDEKTVNGKRVPSKGRAGVPRPGLDPEKMLRELRERMRRAGGKGLPPVGDVKRSSHTRRVVVENGKTVVDEETRDGRPVKRGRAVPHKRTTKKPGKLRRVR